MSETILLIDDDIDLCKIFQLTLNQAGYTVEVAHNGRTGLQKMYASRPAVIILDIMMPLMNGWETCSRIREISDVPIIMLTSMRMQDNVIRGLNLGADDYLTKPIGPDTLVARVKAVLRRIRQSSSRLEKHEGKSIVQLDHLMIDMDRYEVTVDGERVRLSPTEFRLLSVLAKHKGRVLPHQYLLTEVWGQESIGELDYLRMYVSYLRHKIEKDPANPALIQTEWNIGYRFG